MTNGTTSVLRQVAFTTRAEPVTPGFAGPGHTASEVFGPRDRERTDPFVMLMDDRLDFKPGQPVGESHPHAGLETVTLMIEGSLNDSAEGLLAAGDLAFMTAGRGVVHNEDVSATGYARILQLWVALPHALRDLQPDFELIRLKSLPIRREQGVEARIYSGRSGALVSPTRNRVPVTIVDFHLQPGARVSQALPGAYSGLLYMMDGTLSAGEAYSRRAISAGSTPPRTLKPSWRSTPARRARASSSTQDSRSPSRSSNVVRSWRAPPTNFRPNVANIGKAFSPT